MHDLPSPLDPADPDLSIDPVIGWRTWGLRRDRDGRLVLTSPLREDEWTPMRPSDARCGARGFGHRVPAPNCSCGFYAVRYARFLPARIAGLGVPSSFAVAGSVALWGTVVEHAFGYRARYAYPDRLRLVCGACLVRGIATPPAVVGLAGRSLLPMCEGHASERPSLQLLPQTPAEIQAELLDVYGVDLLPDGVWMMPPVPAAAPLGGFAAQLRREIQLLRTTGAGTVVLVALVLAFLLLRSLGAFSSVSSEGGEPWTGMRPTPVAPPIGVTTVGYPRFAEPAPRERDTVQPPIVPVFPVAVCGALEGTTIELRRCGSKAGDVFGTAVSPPEHRSDCVFSTGFTRRNRFSVCWIGPLELILDEIEELQIWQLPRVQYEEVFG